MKNRSLIILGSTGSVGMQAADVARARNYSVRAICANRDVDAVEAQIREFGVRAAAMADEAAANSLKVRTADLDVKIYAGERGICDMIRETDADVVVNSVIGLAGLAPTLACIESGKKLALANKESLVIAGDIVMAHARERGVEISPVDSEHCAIAQCLRAGDASEVKRLLITASGGPFFGQKRSDLGEVTLARALAHPTWKMGAKITIDSATLMNKGFEVIEAARLFGVGEEKISVIVHRESIIHSMVEFVDNVTMAQMSVPDMRSCVQYAVEEPHRRDAVIPQLDLLRVGKLTFAEPDTETFVSLRLAKEALGAGGAATAVLHGANDVAVRSFLEEKIAFTTIFDTQEYVMSELCRASDAQTLEEILGYEKEARRVASEFVATKRGEI